MFKQDTTAAAWTLSKKYEICHVHHVKRTRLCFRMVWKTPIVRKRFST